ncbi:Pimeloyl-ACP methyl ester carboxylesterase [Amycolatopsis tolypomycina]|uniref:Pimeloyl-ACP methyl ester carboxylesterase n=1 Tax=Amycolatopsis tolypomycina TaxID=208445 RepID=A0A1H4I739_9PSEU|nr:alpha/beta hydrolase [Amycolatopsis tolypomycina]SEB29082.1 Pimeloyl-ACP methyl ester carboxylesterase [Amycolatopsis tolypomycina]
MRTEVVGHGGVRLGLRVEGEANSTPIVFVHGWAQSARCWDAQLADPALSERCRLVAVDLRGHGASDVPVTGYDNPEVWADDLAAVLDFAGPDAVVVAWSYGGLVLTDHIRVHGTARLRGLVLVGAITEIGRDRPGGRVGPLMREHMRAMLSDDPDIAVPALTAFSRGMATGPVPGAQVQALLGASLSVPPSVRSALFRRDVGSGEVLAGIDKPTLVVHGTADRVIEPSAAEHAIGKIPGAVGRWFVDGGHAPFAESAAEFDAALRQFAEEC